MIRAGLVAGLSLVVCAVTLMSARELAQPTSAHVPSSQGAARSSQFIAQAESARQDPPPNDRGVTPTPPQRDRPRDADRPPPRGDEPADGPLLANQLEPLLTNLGYEPRLDADAWILTIEREDWTYTLRAALFYNNRFLWVWGYLGDLDQGKLTGAALVRLLETNNEIGPTHFFIGSAADGTKMLYLGRAIDNRGLRASIVRREVDALCGAMRTTHALWESITTGAYPAEAPREPATITADE